MLSKLVERRMRQRLALSGASWVPGPGLGAVKLPKMVGAGKAWNGSVIPEEVCQRDDLHIDGLKYAIGRPIEYTVQQHSSAEDEHVSVYFDWTRPFPLLSLTRGPGRCWGIYESCHLRGKASHCSLGGSAYTSRVDSITLFPGRKYFYVLLSGAVNVKQSPQIKVKDSLRVTVLEVLSFFLGT